MAGLRIQTNVQSLIAQHRLSVARDGLDHVQNKLASGSRIVKAEDDAAGLAISESLRAALRATGQNVRNSQDAFYLLQTADSAIYEISNMIVRMKELAIQSASDTNGDKERTYLNNEYQELKTEIDRISNATTFNGHYLLNGEGSSLEIQVGPNNNEMVDRIAISTGLTLNTETMNLADLQIDSADGAREAIDPINFALENVATIRGVIGAGEARLSTTTRSLMQYEENLSGAFSQIRDADMARETSEFAKFNILNQASVSILAQANMIPAQALKLLG